MKALQLLQQLLLRQQRQAQQLRLQQSLQLQLLRQPQPQLQRRRQQLLQRQQRNLKPGLQHLHLKVLLQFLICTLF